MPTSIPRLTYEMKNREQSHVVVNAAILVLCFETDRSFPIQRNTPGNLQNEDRPWNYVVDLLKRSKEEDRKK